jgi:hypothetical protein
MAIKLAWLINDEGHAPSVACSMVGLSWEDGEVFSEDSSCIDLDDPENELIDLGWSDDELGSVLYTLHRTFAGRDDNDRRRYLWEVRETRQLTNHAADPDIKAVTNGT